MDYDAWLTAPYDEAAEYDQAYRDWCEEHNFDPDNDENVARFDEDMEAQREEYEVETYLHNKEIREYEDGLYYGE